MFCPNCGSQVKDGAVFCENCGAKITASKAPEPTPVPPVQPTPQTVVVQTPPVTKDTLPAQFRPLSAWAYFGYAILFSIPIVGFIFLIVFSCSSANINRRSFARSYWCWLIVCVVLLGILLLIAALTGGIQWFAERIQDLQYM